MIPTFPNFKKIEISDRADINAHTVLFVPYSDFNFTCLWTWDTKSERRISELNGNLVVRFTNYVNDEPFLSFLGTHDCEGTARALIDYCKANELPETLRLMPDVSVEGLREPDFIVEEDRGDFDYIYSIPELSTLRGNKYMSKRGRANKFWQENPDAILEGINLADSGVREKILRMLATWENNKIIAKKEYMISHELEATKRLLSSNEFDELLAVGLFSKGEMLGYFVGERLPNSYALCHFIKYDASYKGINEALMQGCARYLDSFRITHLNFESDLHVESMRQSKTSWRPASFLKRYNVRYTHA